MAAAAAPAVPSAIDDLAVLNQAWAANASSCADAYFAAVMGDALPSALHAVRSDFPSKMLTNLMMVYGNNGWNSPSFHSRSSDRE